jgi:release factor glutamine methyltransferase
LLTLLKEFPQATGVGLDASEEALSIARANAVSLGVADRATLRLGDWRQPDWDAPLGGPFDLVVSNPPYIETASLDGLMPEVARFEPRLALDGGPDGLAPYRLIAAPCNRLVKAGGYLLVEGGEGQAPEISRIFADSGLAVRGVWKDLGGIERIVAAQH